MSGPLGSAQWMASTGSSAFYTKTIDNSLRFDGSSYFTRTPTVTGNRKTWTYSAWVKRSALGATQTIFQAVKSVGANQQTRLDFNSSDNLYAFIYDSSTGTYVMQLTSTAVFRDTSSWYHIVWSFDSTNPTNYLRNRIYVNKIEVSLSGTHPSLNFDTFMNTTGIEVVMGVDGYTHSVNYDQLYTSEINFVDGQALAPTDFGEYDSTGTIWIPKEYAGTYGTNGFHLDYADNTSATTLGYDAAGSNDFTPSGIATSDQMLDSPTNNYPTLNPLKSVNALLAGNLRQQHSTSVQWRSGSSTFAVSSGKWYWEYALFNLNFTSTYAMPGIVTTDELQANFSSNWYPGKSATSYGYFDNGTAGFLYNNASSSSYGSRYNNASVIGVALDLDSATKTLTFYVNGVSQGVAVSGSALDKEWSPALGTYYSGNGYLNFGQDSTFDGVYTSLTDYANYVGATDANGYGSFFYTPPAGFKALCSANLPAPTFDPAQDTSPLDVFNSVLYDGDGIDAHAITGVGFSPDFTWIKARGPNYRYHRLTDTVRGATRSLTTNGDFAEAVNSTHLQSFDADGFTLGTQASFNASGESYVAWNWKLGGSSNTFNIDGTGYATASAAGLDGGTQNPTGATVNTEAGIGIYTYTGDGTAKTIAHGLGVTPKVVILKNRTTGTSNWLVYTNAIDGSMDYANLNLTNAFAASSRTLTSTTFDHGSATDQGAVSNNYVAWVFAEKEGFSKFGSYVGNASADGTFVYTGFRPTWIMAKASSGTGSWSIVDNKRDGYNVDNDRFLAESNAIEDATDYVDILSNGFKFRSNTGMNAAYTYFFMAFAEQPFKYSNAR